MIYPHLTHRKEQTRKIVDIVQQAMEMERSKNDPNSYKNNQCDVVDRLIELSIKHRAISSLLKRTGLKIPISTSHAESHPNPKQK